jgi:cell division protein FtsL
VQYGYKSEELRRERTKLLQQHQLLSLEKETVSSPARLEPAARELGLKPATAGQIATFDSKQLGVRRPVDASQPKLKRKL